LLHAPKAPTLLTKRMNRILSTPPPGRFWGAKATELRLPVDGTRPSTVPFRGALMPDRAEDNQQFADSRDAGDLVGLAGRYEALEGLEHRFYPPGYHSAHEQGSEGKRKATCANPLREGTSWWRRRQSTNRQPRRRRKSSCWCKRSPQRTTIGTRDCSKWRRGRGDAPRPRT